jgi:hypothetical protein
MVGLVLIGVFAVLMAEWVMMIIVMAPMIGGRPLNNLERFLWKLHGYSEKDIDEHHILYPPTRKE